MFVTGFHRAGTHEIAERVAVESRRLYISEDAIRWDCWPAVLGLVDGRLPAFDEKGFYYQGRPFTGGFVLQCPGLAHKTLELAKLGKVYWCERDRLDLITSMRNAGMNEMVWHLMRGFKEQFPDDPIWGKISYDGSTDVHYGFVEYKSLFLKVKQYFFDKYFKGFCEVVKLEDQPFFDREKTLAHKKPLRATEAKRVDESLCIS